jgi:Sec-independent protein translocase protein TatA
VGSLGRAMRGFKNGMKEEGKNRILKGRRMDHEDEE